MGVLLKPQFHCCLRNFWLNNCRHTLEFTPKRGQKRQRFTNIIESGPLLSRPTDENARTARQGLLRHYHERATSEGWCYHRFYSHTRLFLLLSGWFSFRIIHNSSSSSTMLIEASTPKLILLTQLQSWSAYNSDFWGIFKFSLKHTTNLQALTSNGQNIAALLMRRNRYRDPSFTTNTASGTSVLWLAEFWR